MFITVPFVKLIAFWLLSPLQIELNIPNKIKIINTIFVLAISIISCFIVVTSNIYHTKIQNCITRIIPEVIENYADENNYILFVENYTKFEDASRSKEIMIFNNNNNGTHYFLIEKEKEKSIILVYDRFHPENSFEAEYDKLLELDENALVKEYAEIIDNINRGSNYAPVCYLVNEDNILVIYGLAVRDEDTKEFYVSKYVTFDMTTGKISELKN